jgi:16S rRNA (uracil1498-N3)-methyltransferase
MKTHRCFHAGTFATGDSITLDEGESHHLMRVRRARVDDRVLVMNGGGAEFDARLIDPTARRLQMEILGAVRLETEPPRFPALAPGLTQDTDSIIATAIELGVSAIHPMITDRCTVRGAAKKPDALLDRWRRLAISALKQSERLWLPEFHPPENVETVVDRLSWAGLVPVCLVERSKDVSHLMSVLDRLDGAMPALLVGPEGGWSEAEMDLLSGRGVAFASLGSGILRAETASLAALASCLAHRGVS